MPKAAQKRKSSMTKLKENIDKELEEEKKNGTLPVWTLPDKSTLESSLIGRPSKYDDDYHPFAIYELLSPPECLPLYAAARRLGIHRDTIDSWRKDPKKKRFSDALRAGIDEAEAFHAQRLASGSIKYAQGLIFYMKNRHMWKDKSEVEHTHTLAEKIKETEKQSKDTRVNWHDIDTVIASGVHGLPEPETEDDEESDELPIT